METKRKLNYRTTKVDYKISSFHQQIGSAKTCPKFRKYFSKLFSEPINYLNNKNRALFDY